MQKVFCIVLLENDLHLLVSQLILDMRSVLSTLALALFGAAAAAPAAIEKRTFTNARFTWYDVNIGYGACGTWNLDSDMVSVHLAVHHSFPMLTFDGIL